MQLADAIVELIALARSFDTATITELMDHGDINYLYNDTTTIRYTVADGKVFIFINEGGKIHFFSEPFDFFDKLYEKYLNEAFARQGWVKLPCTIKRSF